MAESFLMLRKLKRKIIRILRPRLGMLTQYSPRKMTVCVASNDSEKLSHGPKISIITPSFNHGQFIERTIQSVLGQHYADLEFFVQDGLSNDETPAILERYSASLSGWESRADNGQSHAINLGFARTSGEIMAWLNSDDLLLPGTLAMVGNYFNDHPEVDVIYGNRLLIDENDMEIGRWIMPGHDNNVLSWVDFVPQETLFWRRRIWNKVGGRIDETFQFAMDWDLLVRFRDAGAKFAHFPCFLGAFRIHECQKTSTALDKTGYQEMSRIRQRLLGRVPSLREVLIATLPFLLKHIMLDLAYRVKFSLGIR